MKHLYISDHAFKRYAQRVKPNLSARASRSDLLRLVKDSGEPVSSLAWVNGYGYECNAYLELADGIALPLIQKPNGNWIAQTCLTRSGFGERNRTARNFRKAKQRHAKRMATKAGHDAKRRMRPAAGG